MLKTQTLSEIISHMSVSDFDPHNNSRNEVALLGMIKLLADAIDATSQDLAKSDNNDRS